MGSFSIGHWVIVALVILILFGAGRLGEVGKGLGEGIRNFKKGIASNGEDEDDAAEAKKLKKASKPADDDDASEIKKAESKA
jgi:sec-independent protein translocase protein TatA